jgi:MarR family transcriptional regulator, multiple antibiotic resistance protein MarR
MASIKNEEKVSLQDNIGFLLGHSSQLKDKLLDQHLMALDITATQVKVLFHIYRCHTNRACDVGKALNVDNSAVTRMLDRLEKKSLIQKIPDVEDRRAINIELTEKGLEIIASATPLALNAIEELTKVLTNEEVQQLRHCLQKILAPTMTEYASCPVAKSQPFVINSEEK